MINVMHFRTYIVKVNIQYKLAIGTIAAKQGKTF